MMQSYGIDSLEAADNPFVLFWRAIRAMKEVGLLVREGGDKGGKWIVKKVEKPK